MKPTLALLLAPFASIILPVSFVSAHTAQISIQPVVPHAPPRLLAEVEYSLEATEPTAEIVVWDLAAAAEGFPEGFDFEGGLVRVGVFNQHSRDGGDDEVVVTTTIARASNFFAKGYAPTLQILADPAGAVLGVAAKGVAIDAGYTRDFGPRVEVRVPAHGAEPVLNKPIVLGAGGKQEEEKTMLQKYWWLIGVVVLVTMLGGGEGK